MTVALYSQQKNLTSLSAVSSTPNPWYAWILVFIPHMALFTGQASLDSP